MGHESLAVSGVVICQGCQWRSVFGMQGLKGSLRTVVAFAKQGNRDEEDDEVQ
jgi:hypothetical protein